MEEKPAFWQVSWEQSSSRSRMLAGLTIFAGAVGFLIAVAGSLGVLLVFLIHAIPGFIGGAIGGALRS